MQNLVSVQWLKQNVGNLVLLDASTAPRAQQVIPGSLQFDFQHTICNQDAPFPNTMPSQQQFERQLQGLGIDKSHTVVVYDKVGIYSSARAWWMLKSAGLEKVAVLNGGLPAWVKAGYALAQDYVQPQAIESSHYEFKTDYFCTMDDVKVALGQKSHTLLDARSGSRFRGQERESRPGLASGHIPGSISLPYARIAPGGLMLEPQDLKQHLAPFSDKPIIYTCGSGVTACILALAAERAGLPRGCVYDGSWTEWGSHADNPISSDES